eukprot:757348-Hanusia_phi.AAC.7
MLSTVPYPSSSTSVSPKHDLHPGIGRRPAGRCGTRNEATTHHMASPVAFSSALSDYHHCTSVSPPSSPYIGCMCLQFWGCPLRLDSWRRRRCAARTLSCPAASSERQSTSSGRG